MATGSDSTPWIAKKSLWMNEPFICHIYRNTRKVVQSPSKPLIVHSGLQNDPYSFAEPKVSPRWHPHRVSVQKSPQSECQRLCPPQKSWWAASGDLGPLPSSSEFVDTPGETIIQSAVDLLWRPIIPLILKIKELSSKRPLWREAKTKEFLVEAVNRRLTIWFWWQI